MEVIKDNATTILGAVALFYSRTIAAFAVSMGLKALKPKNIVGFGAAVAKVVRDTIGYVSGAIVATLGSQADSFWDGTRNNGDRGWSPFSGSIDEFRYWKRWRTSKQIQTRWFDQVGGGVGFIQKYFLIRLDALLAVFN